MANESQAGTFRLDQSYVDFGEVDVLGVFVQFGAARAPRDVLDFGNLQ